MFFAMLLVCALSVVPTDCHETSAKHYERAPGGHSLPFTCLAQGQEWAAENMTVPEGAYLKVRCSRHEFGARVG